MRKALFVLLGISSAGSSAMADPSAVIGDNRVIRTGDVRPGRHPLAFRRVANSYAVLGEGTFATRDCTVTARGMEVVLSGPDGRGRRWVTFVDADGEPEAQCELETAARPAPLPVARVVNRIRRGIATTGGR